MLWLVQRIFYGPTSSLVTGKTAPDLLFHEALALWPVAVLMFIMGVASPFWIRAIDPTVTSLLQTIPVAAQTTAASQAMAIPAAASTTAGASAEKQ
jgi:NADH-quinone oxidoreductase subunit M